MGGALVCFDLATTSGIAVGEPVAGALPRVWSHRIDAPGLGEFLFEWENYIARVIETAPLRPSLVVFEAPILWSGKTSLQVARKLMGLTGSCAKVAHRLGVRCEEGRTVEVTRFFTGFGSFGRGEGSRQRKKQAVLDRCAQLGLAAKDDNAADAAALFFWARATFCGVDDSGPLFQTKDETR